MTSDDVPLIASSLCLGHGWHAVAAVEADGSVGYWLIDPGARPDGRRHHTPAHEELGPLPPVYLARLARPPLRRCGRPRKDGAPCETFVYRPGAACHHHRTEVPS